MYISRRAFVQCFGMYCLFLVNNVLFHKTLLFIFCCITLGTRTNKNIVLVTLLAFV